MDEEQIYSLGIFDSGNDKGGRRFERIIYMDGQFNQALTKECVLSILELVQEDQKKPIILLIDSEGGDLYSLISIMDLIDTIPNDVYTIVMGKAMSAAAFLAMIGKKGFRYAFKHSRFMTHEVLMDSGYSSLSEHKTEITELADLQKILNSVFLQKTKVPKADVGKYVSGKDRYMSATEAKKIGLIDHIMDKNIMMKIIQEFILTERKYDRKTIVNDI